MSGRRAKMFRNAARYNSIPIKELKRLYVSLPKSRKLDFIKLEGRLITVSEDYLESLKLTLNPLVLAAASPSTKVKEHKTHG